MTSPLVDPQQTAFFATDPSAQITEQPAPLQIPTHAPSREHVAEVALALGVAFYVSQKILSRELQKNPPPMNRDPYRHIKTVLNHSPYWIRLSAPVLKQSMELGLVQNLTQDELEVMAQSYAEDLGNYVNETSARALVEGFNEQLGAKWSESVAWHRAAAAFGLDSRQMRAYTRGLINHTMDDAQFELLPARAQSFIDQALTQRAERLGGHEAWQAMEAGKAIAWLSQQNSGVISIDAQKQWMTAEDERVCPQCGPLDKVRINLNEQFETYDGNKFWSPGIHPNCRCDIKLVYPEMRNDLWSSVDELEYVGKADAGDKFDRDVRGRFAPVESRNKKPKAKVQFAEPEARTKLKLDFSNATEAIAEQVQETVDTLKEITSTNPYAKTSTGNPYANSKTANPYAKNKTANPYAKEESKTANPYVTPAATSNPYAAAASENPYAQPGKKKARNRQIILFLNGQYQAQVVDDDDDYIDADPAPLYVWAHEHYDNAENADFDLVDGIPHYKDVGIDFDYGPKVDRPGSARPLTTGRIYSEDVGQLYDEAASQYGDYYGWNEPHAQDLVRQYHAEWNDWEEEMSQNIDRNARRLQPPEVRKIMKDAGYSDDYEINDAITKIAMTGRSTNLYHSYINHMEHAHLNDNDVPDSPGAKLEDIETELSILGLRMHVPQVFIIQEQHQDNVILNSATGDTGMAGQYRVVETIYRSAELDEGSQRPDNIKGIKMVYLEPIEDGEEDPWSANHGEDWDYTNYPHDNPEQFPGIDYFQ